MDRARMMKECVAHALFTQPSRTLSELLPLVPGSVPVRPEVEGDWSILPLRWLQSYTSDGPEAAAQRLRRMVMPEDEQVRWRSWNTPSGRRWWEQALERSARAWEEKLEELAGADLVPVAVHPDAPAPWGVGGVSEVPRMVREWAEAASPYITDGSCLTDLDEATRETALALWEPEGAGALTQLERAAEAARVLTG